VVKLASPQRGPHCVCVLCVLCMLCTLCVFVFRMYCVCVCVKVKFTISENHSTGSREEARGEEEGKEEVRDDNMHVGKWGGERETTNFVVNTRMTFARTHTDKHTQGVAGIALFIVGPLGPIHGDRHWRHIGHGIQGSHLRKLRDMVLQAQVLLLLQRRLRGSLRARCKRSRTHST